jgi:hypothetical protein
MKLEEGRHERVVVRANTNDHFVVTQPFQFDEERLARSLSETCAHPMKAVEAYGLVIGAVVEEHRRMVRARVRDCRVLSESSVVGTKPAAQDRHQATNHRFVRERIFDRTTVGVAGIGRTDTAECRMFR